MNVYNCFPGGKVKALTMSYDDGFTEDERLVSIFNQYGIKGTFNMSAGTFDMNYYGHVRVPGEKIAEVYKDHEVATHSYTHPTLARCPLVKVAAEIQKDREALEAITGKPVRGHAYPNGSFNENIKDLFKKLGISYGRAIGKSAGYELPADPLEWYPTCHHKDKDLMKKGQWLVNYRPRAYLRLMYVWGHSYEFADDDNWEVIEDFCKLMGGHEDIWYATNIEIIDYMEVLERLKFSANGRSVYNPSAQSAWLEVDKTRIVEVPGGQFVNLEETASKNP